MDRFELRRLDYSLTEDHVALQEVDQCERRDEQHPPGHLCQEALEGQPVGPARLVDEPLQLRAVALDERRLLPQHRLPVGVDGEDHGVQSEG